MDLIEKKARGTQAQNLLGDEMLQEALREVRYAAHRAFEHAKGDAVKLQRASDLLDSAASFQRFLTLALKHGQAAAKEIDRELQGGRFVRGIGKLVRDRAEDLEDLPWHKTGS